MTFQDQGYQIERGIVSPLQIEAIRKGIYEIMKPHCEVSEVACDLLDACFYALGRQGGTLKNNCYNLFGKLAALPLLLADQNIHRIVQELGFGRATIQAHSIFCLEPGNKRNKFLAHQDLRERTSLRSLLIWVPLSAGPNLGGMACYEGTHCAGPLRHDISETGKPFLPREFYDDARRVNITDFQVGDCIFMDPYLIHESIENTGDAIRWTAVLKLDDARELTHISEALHPFSIDEYIDLRTNEERLKLA